MSAPDLSAEDAAALERLRAHVAKRGAGDAYVHQRHACVTCTAFYVAGADVDRVEVRVFATKRTPAAAILAAGEALGVAL